MKKKLLEVSVVRALVVYLCASLLLAACGKRKQNTETFKRPGAVIVDKAISEEKRITTGSKDNFNQDYIYLISEITPDGIGQELTSELSDAQAKSSLKMAEEVKYVQVSSAVDKSEGALKDNPEGSLKLKVEFYEIDTIGKGEEQKPAKLIAIDLENVKGSRMPRFEGEVIKPVEKPDEKDKDKKEEGGNDANPAVVSPKGYDVVLKCLYKDCSSATLKLLRFEDQATSYFFVSIFKVKIENKDQKVSADEAIKSPKGMSLHPVSNLISNPDLLAMETNTINVMTGYSHFWLGLEGRGLDKGTDRLDLNGRLVRSENGFGNRMLNVKTKNDLVRGARILSHSESGMLRIRLSLNPNKAKGVVEKPVPQATPAEDEKSENFIILDVTPEHLPEQ